MSGHFIPPVDANCSLEKKRREKFKKGKSENRKRKTEKWEKMTNIDGWRGNQERREEYKREEI